MKISNRLSKNIALSEGITQAESIDDLDGTRVEFAGTITDVEVNDGQYGTSVTFGGIFQGIVPETGETKMAKTLYLPGVAEDLLHAQFSANDGPMDFQIAIEAEPAEGSPTGYTWVADTETEADFEDVESLAGGAMTALESGE